MPLREEDPVPLDKRLVRLLKECCEARNIAYEVMPSGAGHDAMQMAKITRRRDVVHSQPARHQS